MWQALDRELGERRTRSILQRQGCVPRRPLHPDLRVVPPHTQLRCRVIILGTLVSEERLVGNDEETVREPRRDIKLVVFTADR